MAEGLFLPPRGENLSREEPGGISLRQGLCKEGLRNFLGRSPRRGCEGHGAGSLLP